MSMEAYQGFFSDMENSNSPVELFRDSDRKPIKSIFDLFHIDIRNQDFETLTPIEDSINKSGQPYKKYIITFDTKECGVFDVLIIMHFGNSFNAFFETEEVTPSTIRNFEKVIKRLHLLYGEDDGKYNGWTSKDSASFFIYKDWVGRYWTNRKKLPNVPVISTNYGYPDMPLSLNIFDVGKFRES